jgi:hypothetical protein
MMGKNTFFLIKRELLVGKSEIIYTKNETIPFILSTPTTRVKTILDKESTNAYLAARSV